MSSWPLISDFARMLQNPQVAFREPELQRCTVEMNQLGQPKARSGNFATVYRGYRPDGSEFAIRIFNRRQDERLEHYRTISDYLEQRALSSIVNFEYDDRGLRSAADGKLYPLLIMEWVPGITLFEWTRDRCREGYAEALQIAADVWLHVVRELTQHNIVHGDLQHGNVMVSPEGHFKLVDYDCMCVPALIGRRNSGDRPGALPASGPQRRHADVSRPGQFLRPCDLRRPAGVGRRSAISGSRTSISRTTTRFCSGSRISTRPASSPLYHELLQSPDEQVRDLAHYLFELARYDLHDVPPVDEVLLWCESIENLITHRSGTRSCSWSNGWAPENASLRNCSRTSKRRSNGWPAARRRSRRWPKATRSGSSSCTPPACCTTIRRPRMCWKPPAAPPKCGPMLRVLASARQLQAWDKLKHTWLAYQHLLKGRASAKAYEHEVQKLLTVDRLREMLARPPVDDAALLEAWEYLEKLGGHPLAEPYRPRRSKPLERRRSVAKLQELLLHAPPAPTLAYDRKIAAAVPLEMLQGLDPAAPLVQQVQAVQERLQYVKKVHELEKAGTLEAETHIADALKLLPKTYHEGLIRRAEQARKRIQIYRQLIKAVEAGSSDEDDPPGVGTAGPRPRPGLGV